MAVAVTMDVTPTSSYEKLSGMDAENARVASLELKTTPAVAGSKMVFEVLLEFSLSTSESGHSMDGGVSSVNRQKH